MPDKPQPLLLATLDGPSIIRVNPAPCTLAIHRPDGRPLVRIDMATGELEYGDGYDPDAAARTFWAALSRAAPARCPNCGHAGTEPADA